MVNCIFQVAICTESANAISAEVPGRVFPGPHLCRQGLLSRFGFLCRIQYTVPFALLEPKYIFGWYIWLAYKYF